MPLQSTAVQLVYTLFSSIPGTIQQELNLALVLPPSKQVETPYKVAFCWFLLGLTPNLFTRFFECICSKCEQGCLHVGYCLSSSHWLKHKTHSVYTLQWMWVTPSQFLFDFITFCLKLKDTLLVEKNILYNKIKKNSTNPLKVKTENILKGFN